MEKLAFKKIGVQSLMAAQISLWKFEWSKTQKNLQNVNSDFNSFLGYSSILIVGDFNSMLSTTSPNFWLCVYTPCLNVCRAPKLRRQAARRLERLWREGKCKIGCWKRGACHNPLLLNKHQKGLWSTGKARKSTPDITSLFTPTFLKRDSIMNQTLEFRTKTKTKGKRPA